MRSRRWSGTVIISVVAATILLASGAVYILNQNNEQALWNRPSISNVAKVESNLNLDTNELQENIQKISDEKAAAKKAAELAQAQAARNSQSSGKKTVTYSIAIRGNPRSSLSEFRQMAAETLNDPRGWSRAGVNFQEVANGGNFTLVLSEAQYLPSYWSGCSVDWSCRVGRNVIINDDRWSSASDSWNAAGGGVRDYRHMVINHEVGHFLGHADNQPVCAGVGQLAPLMQQQSINLRGCTFNPWPLDAELWTKF